ncbi:hypothetical protein HRED_10816, partial [Candidatus Haloredivivus sp. G17]
ANRELGDMRGAAIGDDSYIVEYRVRVAKMLLNQKMKSV